MRKIWSYLTTHLYEDFHAARYSLTFLFLAASLYLNFTYDIEDSFLDTRPELQRLLFYFLSHSIAYYVPAALYAYFSKKKFFRSPDFLVRSFLAITLLSIDRSMPFFNDLLNRIANPHTEFWWYKVTNNLAGIFTLIMPLMIFYWHTDRQLGHRYGLNSSQFDLNPYLLMLLIMLPLVTAASFLPGFQAQYPMYDSIGAHTHFGVPEWITVGIYEAAYGLNFVSIEFFYRGFLVLGLASAMGRGSVLCMASLYCFLHFGKPMGEAISSIFGGYVLGAIAYQTRSIWGGVMVHVGIAWIMELAGYLQQAWR
jgi:hypothetical protein